MRLLLAAHGAGHAASGIEQTRFLLYGPPLLQHLYLAPRLVVDRLLNETDGVHVLDLTTRAKRRAGPAHRDIDIAAQAALLHVAVACAEVAQDRAQLAQIGSRLLG